MASSIIGSHSAGSDNTYINQYNRVQKDILANRAYIDSAHVINYTFSDAGLFGLRVTGNSSQYNEIYDAIRNTLQGIADKVSDEDLEIAKTTLKLKLLQGINNPNIRLNESLRNVKTFGDVKHKDYLGWVDRISARDISSVLSQVLKSKPTLIGSGGAVGTLANRND